MQVAVVAAGVACVLRSVFTVEEADDTFGGRSYDSYWLLGRLDS